jgi:regulatory protein
MDDIDNDVTGVDIRRTAMDLLARREHSLRELDNKLTHRFGKNPLIYPELERLRDERLQSDERFAEAYLFSRAQRFQGPQRIRAELRERGINDTVLEAAFRTSAIDWLSNLEKLAASKFGNSPAADFKEKAKRMRFLQYRGFDVEMINELIL